MISIPSKFGLDELVKGPLGVGRISRIKGEFLLGTPTCEASVSYLLEYDALSEWTVARDLEAMPPDSELTAQDKMAFLAALSSPLLR